jgi:kynurenine formamidase
MNSALRAAGIALLAVLFAWGSAWAGNNPVDEKWWPSEFGANDERGAANYIDNAKRLSALKLVKQGKVASLGRVYHNQMPLIPGRTFALSIPGAGGPTHGPLSWPGKNFYMTFLDELLIAEIGQVGTQFDGLGHPMIRVMGMNNPDWPDGDYMYNKVRIQDYNNTRGLVKNGVHHVEHIVTRGILIDVAALKGKKMLDKAYVITLDDYKAALSKQGIGDATKGDVVIFRTGWGNLWVDNLTKSPEQRAKDNAEFGSGEPGPGPEVCDYLADKKITMIASDTWGLEPYPPFPATEDDKPFAYCHMNLVARRGIYNFENLDAEQLSREKVYEFMFSWGVLRLQGATGAPGNPLALY